jgi:F0F1-type ATP synthase membrane subunit b/b'
MHLVLGEAIMSNYRELLGRRFRIVENGLDPDEITEYLMKEIGSSESTFRQLEQFSALEQATKTIDDAIQQAKELAEHAKIQAKAEVAQQRARAIEEAKMQAAEIVEQARKGCTSLIDGTSDILIKTLDGVLEKAKNQIEANLPRLRENFEKTVEIKHPHIDMSPTKSTEQASSSRATPGNTAHAENAAPVAQGESGSDPWRDSV